MPIAFIITLAFIKRTFEQSHRKYSQSKQGKEIHC